MENQGKKSNYCDRCHDFHDPEVREFTSCVKIGEMVPDYEFEIFQNDDTKTVKFSDFRGKWLVVMFYPADFTFVCPTELEDMAKLYPKIKELGGEVLSFSTDTVFVHKAWHDTSDAIKKISFPMGADPSGKISYAFGTLVEGGDMQFTPDEGLSLRGTFLIDPNGVLKTIEIHHNAIGRSAKETLRKLEACLFVEKHGDKVCPAGWEPGDDTLEPGMDLVGKI